MAATKKEILDVLQAHSLRELVETVNLVNETGSSKILKDNIVTIFKDEDTYFMLYYK